jgi:hypothetical protein
MTVSAVLDAAGRRRSPATLPGFHAGRAPRNKAMLYPADPPTVEEIVCVMRQASEDPHGFRLRAMIVMLWRGGLRVRDDAASAALEAPFAIGIRGRRALLVKRIAQPLCSYSEQHERARKRSARAHQSDADDSKTFLLMKMS